MQKLVKKQKLFSLSWPKHNVDLIFVQNHAMFCINVGKTLPSLKNQYFVVKKKRSPFKSSLGQFWTYFEGLVLDPDLSQVHFDQFQVIFGRFFFHFWPIKRPDLYNFQPIFQHLFDSAKIMMWWKNKNAWKRPCIFINDKKVHL